VFPKKLRLRTALVVPFLLQITGAVALVGWLSFQSGERSVRELASRLHTETSKRVSDRVESYVATPQLVNRVNVDAVELGILDFQNIQAARSYFWRQANAYTSIGYVGFANENAQSLRIGWINRLDPKDQPQIAEQLTPGGGDLVFYNLDANGKPSKTERTIVNYDVRTRPFYQVGKVAGKPTWSEIYANFAYPTLLQMNATTPYYDATGKFIGILTCQIALNQIGEFLQTLPSMKSGQIYILERDGKIVATSLKDQPVLKINEKSKEKTERIDARQSQSPVLRATADAIFQKFPNLDQIQGEEKFDFAIDQVHYFLHVAPFRDNYGLNWLVVVVAPESDFMEQINANARNTIFLCILAFVGVSVTCVISSRWITQPILQMVEASEQMAAGHLQHRIPASLLIEVDKLAASFNSMSAQLSHYFEELEERVKLRTSELNLEKERSEMLLRNVLPQKIVNRLKDSSTSQKEYFAEHFDSATILFADLVGFTTLAAQMDALDLVNSLNQIFSEFDQIAEQFGLEKIKTIGDAYMVVGGVPMFKPNHAVAIAEMAIAMQNYLATFEILPGQSIQIRIGINTGSVIAGVIGTKKFIYDLWGDAVNVASRMESHGLPGQIQVTDTTYELLKDHYHLEPRGTIKVKGRGDMMTYWLKGKLEAT